MPDFSNHRQKTSKLVGKVGSKAVELQATSSQHVAKYVTKRASRIIGVRRFMAGWLSLVALLSLFTAGTFWQLRQAAQTNAPARGGTYTEGVVGSVNNLSPLFSSGTLDDSTARLIFNGLLRYDTTGALAPDLAREWSVDSSGKVYSLKLQPGVLWHDGEPLTAEDVIYTIQTIQNPATRSTRLASWQGVKVAAVNQFEVSFELPAPFAPFPGALTLPILPKHLLQDIAPEKLRTASFNTNPVGTGPFVFTALRSEANAQRVEFSRNADYFRGAPQLEKFVIRTFTDEEHLATALREREITAAVDLKAESIMAFSKDTSIRPVDTPVNSGVFAFFKTTTGPLADTNVRLALAKAIDRQVFLSLFDARFAPLKSPLLGSQLGYSAAFNQQTNIAEAGQMLDAAGWAKQANGMRAKDGLPLELGLTTLNSSQYSAVAGELQKQWERVGVSVKPQLLASKQLQQNALSAHAYDILLYGISIGSDPDVYAYWHSSQARAGGLNFSEWKSGRADSSLETARTRLDPVLREARYRTFQDEWLKAAPAVALYQPRVNYAYHQNATGFVPFAANNISERLTNVEAWTVNTRRVGQTP